MAFWCRGSSSLCGNTADCHFPGVSSDAASEKEKKYTCVIFERQLGRVRQGQACRNSGPADPGKACWSEDHYTLEGQSGLKELLVKQARPLTQDQRQQKDDGG